MSDNKLTYDDLERMALAFVLETETWPVFIEWVRIHHRSEAAHNWLREGPSGYELRKQWIEHKDHVIKKADTQCSNTETI